MQTKRPKIHSTKLYQIHELEILTTLIELNPWNYITPDSPEVCFDELVSVLAARRGLTLYPSYVKRLVDKRIRGYYRHCRDPTKLDSYCEKVAPEFKGVLLELIRISEMGGRRVSRSQLPNHSNILFESGSHIISQRSSSPHLRHLGDKTLGEIRESRSMADHRAITSGLFLYDLAPSHERNSISPFFENEPMVANQPSPLRLPPIQRTEHCSTCRTRMLPSLTEVIHDFFSIKTHQMQQKLDQLNQRYEFDLNIIQRQQTNLVQEKIQFHSNLMKQRVQELAMDRAVMDRFFERWELDKR